MTEAQEKAVRQRAEDYMLKNYPSAKEEGFADPYYKAGWLDATKQFEVILRNVFSDQQMIAVALEAMGAHQERKPPLPIDPEEFNRRIGPSVAEQLSAAKQNFREDEANRLHGHCRCSSTDGGGDCDWCMVYYGKVDSHEDKQP